MISVLVVRMPTVVEPCAEKLADLKYCELVKPLNASPASIAQASHPGVERTSALVPMNTLHSICDCLPQPLN